MRGFEHIIHKSLYQNKLKGDDLAPPGFKTVFCGEEINIEYCHNVWAKVTCPDCIENKRQMKFEMHKVYRTRTKQRIEKEKQNG